LGSKAIYCIGQILEALRDGNASLIERAAMAIAGLTRNSRQTEFAIIDAIERAALRIGKAPWNFSAEEAERIAKAQMKNHAPELAAKITRLHLEEPMKLAAVVRSRGRPRRGEQRQGTKWPLYRDVLATLGLQPPAVASLEADYRRWKRANKG
jgi:hypothetical protein